VAKFKETNFNIMEIIDAHAHIYPEKIAQKATDTIGVFYDIKMEMPAGTAERLIEDGSRAKITGYLVHSVATTAHQVRAINEFIKREIDAHKEFIGFMTLHQDLSEEEIKNEIDWCIENGFKGIKLHPDFQKFYIDGEEAEKIYRAVGDKLPILLHVGDKRYEYSKPIRLANMAKKYPNVNFICAHMGGYMCWDDADVFIGLNNVYFDTCSSLPFITISKARSIIKKLGAERFFFATDFPMWDSESELERFNRVPLTEKERKMILSENIKKLLKLD
jgi:predicted TIM-barrel fold metal-dependent hydrolase